MFYEMKEQINGRNAAIVSGLGPYSLKDTLECGQCFRYELITEEDGYIEYMTVVGDTVINVAQRKKGELIFFGLTDEELRTVAYPYFAIDRDLEAVKLEVCESTDSTWLKEAAEVAKGIAILRQDPFEALISFIISQNNNIPRIRKIIRSISAHYGVNLALQKNYKSCPLKRINSTPCEEMCKNCGCCYTFPTAAEILSDPDGLLPSKPGFRFKYILDAASKVDTGAIDLNKITETGRYAYTVEELKKILGVGDKVAACTALFGFSNLEAFPIDVWMKRAIDTYFDGKLDPTSLGRYAGIAQQYIFYYIRILNEVRA